MLLFLSGIYIWEFTDTIIKEDKLVWSEPKFKEFVKKLNEFLNFLRNVKTFCFPSTKVPMSHNYDHVSRKFKTENSSENIDDSLKIVVKTISCSVKGNNKCVDILDCLQCADHLSDMFGVSSIRVTKAWGIKNKYFFKIIPTEPCCASSFSFKRFRSKLI